MPEQVDDDLNDAETHKNRERHKTKRDVDLLDTRARPEIRVEWISLAIGIDQERNQHLTERKRLLHNHYDRELRVALFRCTHDRYVAQLQVACRFTIRKHRPRRGGGLADLRVSPSEHDVMARIDRAAALRGQCTSVAASPAPSAGPSRMQQNMPQTLGLNRLLGGAIGVIALVSVLSSGAVLITGDQLREATDARSRSNQLIRALDNFRAAMLNQETGLRGYLITGRDGSLEPYRTGRLALDEAIDRLRSLIGQDPERTRLLADAVAAARSWQTEVGEVAIRIAADPAKRDEAVHIEANGQGKRLFDTFRERLAAIEGLEGAVRTALAERVVRGERNESVALWGGTLLTLLICLGIGVAINRLIVQPLVRVMSFVERVGEGNLSDQLEVRTGGEVGRLGVTLNAMVAGLSDLARTNRAATADLNAAAAEIR
ncbi:CHASE3 domain-containing protein, partial [Methylobacterium sp. UNC378MF]|uniref:CHASE3 domain-containing protein n=1 Tax=Methylobacterium sp. UNC378MF TaxID=1502748 RepID=UPI00244E7046